MPGGVPSPGDGALPVLPALRELLPGGLPRGTVATTGRWGLLCLALAAGPSAAGAWCAVAGVPQLGVAAAAGVGLDPARMLVIPDPGPGWPQVVISLLDGCEVVLLWPPGRPPAGVRRKLEASLRRCGGVLVVAGDWPGAQARLLVARQEWAGIGAGHGRLRARRVQVVADGRGAAARSRARWLWLPGPDGSVSPADEPVTLMNDPSALVGDPVGLMGDPVGLMGDPVGLMGDPVGLMGDPGALVGEIIAAGADMRDTG